MLRLFLKQKVSSRKSKPKDPRAFSKRNRRIFDRFPVDHKHLTMMNEQDILLVREISAKGFSTSVSKTSLDRFQIGDTYSARFRYLGESYDVEAKVSWKDDEGSLGFEISKHNDQTREFIQRLLKPIAIASSLKKVDATFMRNNKEGKTWYHGDNDTDLYTWEGTNGQLKAWQFITNEVFLEWNEIQGMRTGYITVTNQSVSGITDLKKESLQQVFDPSTNQETLLMGLDIIMASNIEQKKLILETSNLE